MMVLASSKDSADPWYDPSCDRRNSPAGHYPSSYHGGTWTDGDWSPWRSHGIFCLCSDSLDRCYPEFGIIVTDARNTQATYIVKQWRNMASHRAWTVPEEEAMIMPDAKACGQGWKMSSFTPEILSLHSLQWMSLRSWSGDNFISYWNNRRICTSNKGLAMIKRKRYYDSLAMVA